MAFSRPMVPCRQAGQVTPPSSFPPFPTLVAHRKLASLMLCRASQTWGTPQMFVL